jgi:hypothetical protein
MSADRDVLTSLPNARPTRRSAKRRATPATDGGEAGKQAAPAKPAAAAKRAPAKARASAKAGSAKKAGATASAKRTSAAKAGAKRSAKAAPPSSPSSPPPPPAGWAAPKQQDQGTPGVGTAIQAVGELAQIGLTFGGQAIRQALSKLPRP